MSRDKFTIFVGGFGPFLTESEIRTYFGKYGEILYIILKKDNEKGINKGFAFVRYDSQESVDKVLAAKHELDGRRVDVAIAHSGMNKDQDTTFYISHRLCVKGLAKSVTNEEMEDYFNKFGEVRKAFVIMDPVTKQSKLFGYVEFTQPDTKDKVLGQKKPHYLKGKKIVVEPYLPRFVCKQKQMDEKATE